MNLEVRNNSLLNTTDTSFTGNNIKKCIVVDEKVKQLVDGLLVSIKMTDAHYQAFLDFAESKKSDWESVSPNAPLIRYPLRKTGLSRSATFVPGQGLLIHLKGSRRGLSRMQLGERGVQGVVTKALNLHTGALRAFKSMPISGSAGYKALIKKRLAIHKALQDFPDEFASGPTICYERSGCTKIGLFMPLMDGGELPYSICPKQQVPYALQLAKELDHLHTLGFLHRDLKRENILVSADLKTLILADFESAVPLKSNEAEIKPNGNLEHMAPEVFGLWLKYQVKDSIKYDEFVKYYGNTTSGHKCINFNFRSLPKITNEGLAEQFAKLAGTTISEKSEVFSLGMILYEMRYANLCVSWPQNEAVKSDPYEKLIARCLQLHPDQRPTMQQVVQELTTKNEE